MIKHLLPRARAWGLSTNTQLREFIDGLAGFSEDARSFIDETWLDIFPATTRELDVWEKQFGLPNVPLTDSERQSRLDAAWKAQGGQDPRYLQDTLQAAGFDVWVHEWFDPTGLPAVGVQACVTPRNPNSYLRAEYSSTGTPYTVLCGEVGMECGEVGVECGESSEPLGYPLFNKVVSTQALVISLCGEAVMETFGTQATITPNRRNEFEELCLRICPVQQALGIMVTYT